MSRPPQDPPDSFPFEAVRDLLGIVRSIYAAAKAEDAGASRLTALTEVGRDLAASIEIALRTSPRTSERAEAFRRADRATLRLGDLIDAITPIEPTVDAAVRRVRAQAPGTGREEARRERTKRG